MYKLLFAIFAFLLSASWVEGQTVLQGQVVDKKGPLGGVKVKIVRQDTILMETLTDIEGNYQMSIDSGNCNVEFSYPKYIVQRIEGVEILPGKSNVLNLLLSGSLSSVRSVEIIHVNIPMLRKDGTESGRTFTADQLRHTY